MTSGKKIHRVGDPTASDGYTEAYRQAQVNRLQHGGTQKRRF